MAEIFIRRGVFYCRVIIPTSLRATLGGRSQIWKNLRTQSSDVAALQAARWDGRVSRLFFCLAQSAHTMTPAQIQTLVAEYVNGTLESVEEFSLTRTRTDDEREATSLAITDQLEDSTGELLNNDFHRVAVDADALLAKHGLTVERNSLDWKRLCRGLLVGLQTALQTELRNVEGDYTTPPLPNGKSEPPAHRFQTVLCTFFQKSFCPSIQAGP